MLPLLCNGYYVEFIVFWRRVGGLGKAGNATTWLDMFWVLTGGFLGRDRVSGPMLRQGFPCVAT